MGISSSNGLGHHVAAAVFIEPPQEIDQSYHLKKWPLSSVL
jgi:hypothetical protein